MTHPLLEWTGPGDTRIPFGDVTRAALREALEAAIATWRRNVAAIVGDAAAPSYANTLVAWEQGARTLERGKQLLAVFAHTLASPEFAALESSLLPEITRAEDEALLDPQLFARFDALLRAGPSGAPDAEAFRAVELLHERFVRRGVRLDPAGRERLAQINSKIANAGALFARNMTDAERELFTLVTDPAQLDGISDTARAAAAKLASDRGPGGAWAIANQRPVVLDVLATAKDRALRERVWRLWNDRCGQPGSYDNRGVLADLVALRNERARLLGFEDHAAFATSNRMARSADRAMDLLASTWERVLPATQRQLDEAAEIARADGLEGPLQPWDRYFYEERARARRFGFDASAVRAYLAVDGVVAASLEAASRLHGIAFEADVEAPRTHPDVSAWRVMRGGEFIGLLYFDVIARPQKRTGSWMHPLQLRSSLERDALPVGIVTTSVPASAGGEPPQMSWVHAVTLFHEVGHALHLLLAQTNYPSVGMLSVPWDFVELPALLNERWIEDRELMRRHFRHWRTGEPIPDALAEGVLVAARHDRVFSVTLGFLAGAIMDLELHSTRPGSEPAEGIAAAVEQEVLAKYGMPAAIDQIMRPPHFFHLSTDAYAAGVYSYLWGDVMAADVAEVFLESAGGLYDTNTARRWYDTLLCTGALEPADAAYRRFRGRDQTPDALLRRFELA